MTLDVLQYALEKGIINLDDVAAQLDMSILKNTKVRFGRLPTDGIKSNYRMENYLQNPKKKILRRLS